MMKKLWGLLLILLISNSCIAETLQNTIKNNIKKCCSKENIAIAKSALYATQIVSGLFIAGVITQELIEQGCVYDHRIALGGFALVASSFLYNGCKGIYDLAHENITKNKESKVTNAKITPGTISKKFLKLLYHGAEIFIASGFLYGDLYECKTRGLPACMENCTHGSIAMILLANGSKGIDKELQISAHIQKVIEKMKKKQNDEK